MGVARYARGSKAMYTQEGCMKIIHSGYIYFFGLIMAIAFAGCARQYNFTLKDTLAIFLLNNDAGYSFCIPIQYMGDFQVENFEFTDGHIILGEYEIPLQRYNVTISAYLNEEGDEAAVDSFKPITLSKMSDPLTQHANEGEHINHYYIILEYFLNSDDTQSMIAEYKKGNVYSQVYINFNITIDKNRQEGSGIWDDFELYDGIAIDPAMFPPNLNFFKAKYMQK
jgi:hypothetical protein